MKKIIIVLLIVLSSCSKDDVEPIIHTPVNVTHYKLHVKTESNSIGGFRVYLYADSSLDNLLADEVFSNYSGYFLDYTFNNDTDEFYLYFTKSFYLESYTLTKYFDNGTNEIIEHKENIASSNSFFKQRRLIDVHGNNVVYNYFNKQLHW